MEKISNRNNWKVGNLFKLDYDEWIIYEILNFDDSCLVSRQAFIPNSNVFVINPSFIYILSKKDLEDIATSKIDRIITPAERQQIRIKNYLNIHYEKII